MTLALCSVSRTEKEERRGRKRKGRRQKRMRKEGREMRWRERPDPAGKGAREAEVL